VKALEFRFVLMTLAHAQQLLTWKYAGKYAIYDYANEAEWLLSAKEWPEAFFAVLDERGELIGECAAEMLDRAELDGGEGQVLSIGFGLRPDLTGRGIGPGFVSACFDNAVRHFNYNGPYVRLGVAAFNTRAIKAYAKAGFREYRRFNAELAGETMEIVEMVRER
jgi:ribosomal-protein-alanine N-acetyltransferase